MVMFLIDLDGCCCTKAQSSAAAEVDIQLEDDYCEGLFYFLKVWQNMKHTLISCGEYVFGQWHTTTVEFQL